MPKNPRKSSNVLGTLDSQKSDETLSINPGKPFVYNLGYCYRKNYVPQGPQNVTLFGYRVFTEVIKLKRGH